jgi:HK97 family phage portal protein
MGEFGGWHGIDPLGDGWQRHLHIGGGQARHVAPVYAAVALNCRAAVQFTPRHMVPDGTGFKASTTSPASRIFRIPNGYETWAQLIFNTVAELLFEGECLWIASRDERQAIASVHRIPRGQWTVFVEPESREVFYAIGTGGNPLAPLGEAQALIPARDVAHFRQHCPRHPLIGESPVKAAAMAIGINVALNASQMAFFSNMSRPSGILTTDQVLAKEQIVRLKEVWEAASTAMSQGKVPVLVNGLKFQPMALPQADQQLIEQQRLSIEDIARVFGVPTVLLSSDVKGDTEHLINHWLSVGLGSVIEFIERTLERLFALGPSEHIELDPTPLVRINFAARVEGLAKAVQSGIMTPNEARHQENLPRIDHADTAFMQQQMVGLDLLNQLHAAQLASAQARISEPANDGVELPAEREQGIDPEAAKALLVTRVREKVAPHG